MQEGMLLSQLTHAPTAYNYLYCHKKAEEFDPVKNYPETTEREPEEIDLTNLSEKEFKMKVITMLMDLQRNMQELKDQVRRENTEIKQSLVGLRADWMRCKRPLME